MTPDVSVLIPAFDTQHTIWQAVKSALTQIGVSVEVNVCDDGSEAPLESVFEQYRFQEILAADAPLSVVYHDTNQGQAAALNTAAERATGRYLIELDADDRLADGALAALVHALDNAPAHVGMAYGCVQYEGALTGVHVPPAFRRADFWRGFPALYPFMYRREAWDAGCRYAVHATIEGKPHSVQDWDMFLQCMEFMRYDGLALPDTLVLHYHANTTGAGQALKDNSEAVVAGLRARWPKLQAVGL
jgi:glycosyltransferase involved in cell wall biosynthesis